MIIGTLKGGAYAMDRVETYGCKSAVYRIIDVVLVNLPVTFDPALRRKCIKNMSPEQGCFSRLLQVNLLVHKMHPTVEILFQVTLFRDNWGRPFKRKDFSFIRLEF